MRSGGLISCISDIRYLYGNAEPWWHAVAAKKNKVMISLDLLVPALFLAGLGGVFAEALLKSPKVLWEMATDSRAFAQADIAALPANSRPPAGLVPAALAA